MSLLGSGSIHLQGRLARTPKKESPGDGSQQCQNCLECKNKKAYKVRPSRTQQLHNPNLRPKLMDEEELLDEENPNSNKETKEKTKPAEVKTEENNDANGDVESSSSDSEDSENSSSSGSDSDSEDSSREDSSDEESLSDSSSEVEINPSKIRHDTPDSVSADGEARTETKTEIEPRAEPDRMRIVQKRRLRSRSRPRERKQHQPEHLSQRIRKPEVKSEPQVGSLRLPDCHPERVALIYGHRPAFPRGDLTRLEKRGGGEMRREPNESYRDKRSNWDADYSKRRRYSPSTQRHRKIRETRSPSPSRRYRRTHRHSRERRRRHNAPDSGSSSSFSRGSHSPNRDRRRMRM